jgi:hypothetical protein
MIQRAVAAAETGSGSDRFLYKRAGSLNGVYERHPLSEAAGDGRRECATRAVRVFAFNARRCKALYAPIVDEHVFDHIAAGMAAFDEHG